ncbi:BspA family leucine-rich repeat surface protein [Mesohalobacter halotolerans]|uniref:BspA family leucine-rich repeat surface protein n=1 Tax=Mesohalobacter halotolerans TaxID=1883405 RepID=A0A4U5TNL1_9FLAO|nr:BspA family leucine-rich repeat surface protein [Mesohalobacter halotolerans]TKS55570.1 BspA family leucine-rich repeat surface protein [Mesohalobacter halotolerans]
MKNNLILFLFFIVFTTFSEAQDFITTWQTINGQTSISFGVETTGTVSYTWETLPPAAPASGSGTFQGPVVTISGLPANVDFRLEIEPQNFKRFLIGGGNPAPFSFLFLEINQWGDVAWSSMEDAFGGVFLVSASDIPDLSNVTSMKNMFANSQSLNSPFNLNFWDILNVTNLSGMFFNCDNFNQALSQWDTSNVTDMSSMFEEARSFNQNIGTWDTSNVTDMSKMFKEASSFDNNIGNWNTANVTNMSEMFNGGLNSGFEYQFNKNISAWNTANVTDMSAMFKGATLFNQNIGFWDTSNVTDMSEMFNTATSFNQNIGNWDTSSVTDMSQMFFNNPSSLNEEPLSFNNGGSPLIENWDTTNVVNFSNMFFKAENFNYDLGSWSLAQAQDLTGMLDQSGLDCNQYSSTLMGWSNNSSTPDNLILGASLLKYTSDALPSINNLLFNKGWGISGHDIVSTIPEFNIDTIYCEGEPSPNFPSVSNDGINGSWSPAFDPNQTTTYTFTPNPNECALSTTLTVTVLDGIDTPTGNSQQTVSSGSTISDLVVIPSTVIWYATLQDALDNVNALASNFILEDGETYYAVNDNGQCRSQPFAVTVTITLSVESKDFKNLNYYPNPVGSTLHISNNLPLKQVLIYNISGQLLIKKSFNDTEINLDLNTLPQSTYIAKIKTDGQSTQFKIIKQ